MPFDAAWFDELRGLTEDKLRETRERGIGGYVPHVGELRRDRHVTSRFLEECLEFVHLMDGTPYRFDIFFRTYERHVVNYPKGSAFRKQWNIAFTAGDSSDEDYVRIGIGFRLSAHEKASGIEEYLEFREQVRRRQAAFDQTFQALGNYYEFLDWEPPGPSISGSAAGALSLLILTDQPPLDGWRFFGRRLWVHDPQDQAVIGSHDQLRDAVIDVCDRIQRAGFGM
jgi:hypothetical protein